MSTNTLETSESKMPQHRRLYELLRKHIRDGLYAEGDMLPSENELCALHQVTRPTVRQALSTLVNESYIKKQQGKGSIVQPLPKGIGILSLQGTTVSVGSSHLQTQLVAKPSIMPWPEDFPYDLTTIEKESGCIKLERTRSVDGAQILFDVSYIPNINLPRFCQKSFDNKSLFEVLRTYYQIEVTGGTQRLQAIPVDDMVSKYLNLKLGMPILKLERILETNRDGLRFFSFIYCDTSKYYLEGNF
ncbi:MAG: GntR family transcriptional regulator [Cyclobacteriaceae bacterium]